MSQLKKQSISGRKTTRRNVQPSASGRPAGLGKRLLRTFEFIGLLLRWTYNPFRFLFKRWPKASILFICSLAALGTAAYGALRVVRSVTSRLPDQIRVISPRTELQSVVSNLARDTLSTAQRDNWGRSVLVDKLLSRISAVDGVDEVSIRSGLDNKLTINLVAQVPLLVLEGKENERILIGSKFKIIARSLGRDDYNHLPHLEAPELSLNIRVNREKKKAHSGLFIRPTSTSSANIRWLSQQSIKIYSHFEAEKIPVEVVKILWKNGTGFSAIVKQKDVRNQSHQEGTQLPFSAPVETTTVQNPTNSNQFNIILGENQFQEKFARLQQIIQDLRLKNSLVDQIDLAFSDKAIIKLKDQFSEVKRGGIQ